MQRANPFHHPSRLLGVTLAAAMLSCSISIPPAKPMYSAEQLNALAQHPPPDEPMAEVTMVPPPRAHAAAASNQPPEIVRRDVPASVVAGREVYFGIDVVDDELDPVKVELAQKPEGAELDPRTLTVHWRVPRNATGAQTFNVRVTQTPPGGEPSTTDIPLSVNVTPARGAPAQAAPATAPAPRFVGTLVTITDPNYLGRTAHEWPIERLLEVGRDAGIDTLPVDQQSTVDRTPGRVLFNQLLTNFARAHNNPRLDPNSPQFDHRFESSHWRLVAVRPRLNRQIQELRMAFQAVDVPEPVFVMFRWRFFRGPFPQNADVVRANNQAFTRLYYNAFFQGSALKPGIQNGQARAVAEALATFVRSVLTYRDPQNPLVRIGLAAIPEEARMGGGSTFDAQGNYQSGNAWGFTVAKMDVENSETAGRRVVHVNQGPTSGFTFDIGPNAAGDHFVSVCPPRYRAGGEGYQQGWEAFCLQDGTVRLHEQNAQGQWVPARRDTMNEHLDQTAHEMVSRVPLRDSRRRNFEESGMTCVQCHIRNFDDGVLSEVQASDPRVHEPITPPRAVARVPMQILPVRGVERAPWFVQQETEQVCDVGRDIHELMNVDVGLPCPEGY